MTEGYEWQGRPYRSLSAVARAITGTRWNGLVFFGVRGVTARTRTSSSKSNRADNRSRPAVKGAASL